VAHVLVVEDNADAAETLRIAMELEGMTVTVAGDGTEGLAAARRIRPGLVICDIGLPGALDGYAVAREIRADPELRETPLIAVTGYASADDRARAREAGFDRHLAKPAAVDEVIRAVASVMCA
jgi:two-component system CheB/CheR fusion protein